MKTKRDKEIQEMLDELIKKYGESKVAEFKSKYNEALDLFIDASVIEEEQGAEIAQMECGNDAELIMAQIPEDYKAFREKLDCWD